MAFRKGYIPWNKGKEAPQIAEALRGKKMPYVALANSARTGENARHWTGDKVEYQGLHSWIRKQKGTPSFCEHCFSTIAKRYEWANINGDYNRDLDGWIRLCKKCHIEYDRNNGRWGETTQLILAQKEVVK